MPISVFGAFLGLLNPIREREAIRQGMTDTARALSLAVDRQAGIAITGPPGGRYIPVSAGRRLHPLPKAGGAVSNLARRLDKCR